ncbi:MAG: UDP-N-acetylmuramoyl-tripeptide--D-alanyl-D-alanine ligase [Actinobacteria bacterium]|nr:UDP-N-acetylmuramoyl-tripeptide--D-alanyl-D-alanine ligase [Actinomycetota bacterium]
MRIEAPWVAQAVRGVPVGRIDDIVIDGCDFDSRTIGAGQLFVALVGERDGHRFLEHAAGAGAALHLCSDRAALEAAGVQGIVVDDTLASLADLATAARRDLLTSVPVVGVTGSVGKTSTKDLIAAALSAERMTHANRASFNNEQGLPVTVLGAPDDTEALVVEMGMRGHGQIAELCRIARPDVGVVTVVGESHTELVGGLDGVARAKGELIEALPSSGTAVLNAGDERVSAMAARSSAPVVTFGDGGEVRPEGVCLDASARASFTVVTPWGRAEVRLGLVGEHMVANACAAIAVAGSLHGDIDAAAAALSEVTSAPGRMTVHRGRGGSTIIDDCYNANPTSVEAALRALDAVPARRRIAVLGIMAELDAPGPAHLRVAAICEDLGIELLAVDCPLYGVESMSLEDLGDLDLAEDSAVLVKGSRVAGLERAVAALMA